MFSEQLTFILASIHFILVAAETKARKQKNQFIKISNWQAQRNKPRNCSLNIPDFYTKVSFGNIHPYYSFQHSLPWRQSSFMEVYFYLKKLTFQINSYIKHCMRLNPCLHQLLLNYSLQDHKKWGTPALRNHTAFARFSPGTNDKNTYGLERTKHQNCPLM